MKNIKYTINGMSCNSCAMKIESEMNKIPEIHNANVNFSQKTLTLEFKEIKTPMVQLQNFLSKIGRYTLKPFRNAKTKTNYSPYIWGLVGSLGISIVFYLIQTLGMQNFYAPLEFSIQKWYFILPLITGFGVQMGLFRAIRLKAKTGSGVIAASGGVSTSSMIACCMHNLVTLFPILGLSGAAVFLATYQDYIFGFSLLFVIGGVAYMIQKYRKLHECCKINN